MNIRLRVKTPPGHAETVEKQLRVFLLGRLKKPADTWVSPDASEFYWAADTDIKTYFRISRNARLFQMLAGGTLDQIEKRTWIKKMAQVTGETINGARRLIEETEVEVVKNATAEELDEAGKSFWTRMKERFRKQADDPS